MSDNIRDLPINKYSNPTPEEINILNSLFNTEENKFDIHKIKVTIIITLLYIIFILFNKKNKYNLKLFISISSIIFPILIYFTQSCIN